MDIERFAQAHSVKNSPVGHTWFSIGFTIQDDPQPFTYGEDYYKNYIDRETSAEAEGINRARIGTCISAGLGVGGNVLDIGVGSGQFIRAYDDFFEGEPASRAFGFDINPVAASMLSETEKYFNPYGAAGIAQFEAVTMWDAFEHIPNPEQLLALFAKGQKLITSLPVFSPVFLCDRLSESKHFKPDEHLIYFTRAGLIWYLEKWGFSLIHYNEDETEAGRKGIGTFVFVKA